MSSPISVETIGLKEFEKALSQLDDVAAEGNLVTAAKAGALPIRNAAAENAPKRTRTLARSIHVEPLDSSPTHAAVMVGTDVVYAPVHEFGAVITPKRAKMLAFEIDGELVFAHSVHIPARPYMRPAFDNNVEKATKEVKEVLAHLLDKVAK